MKVLLFSGCASVSIDSLTNRLSVFHFLDGAASSAFPFVMPPLTLVTWIERSDNDPRTGDISIRVKINGEQVIAMPMTFDFQDKNRTRLISEIGGVAVHAPGKLLAELVLKGKVLSAWDMPVQATPSPRITKAAMTPSETSKGVPATRNPKSRGETTG